MRKYQWLIIIALIGYIVSFASCEQGPKIMEPLLPDVETEPPVEMMPENEGIGIFDTAVMAGHGFLAEAYIPSSRLTQVPDFETLTPFHTWLVANVDAPVQFYDHGFPELGLNVLENFAIRLRGRIKVETAGTYHFALRSDDGSKLYINGLLIIDHDGLHGISTKEGNVMLPAGFHDVFIGYFQGPRAIGLQWFWRPPEGVEEIVPPGVLYPPDTTATP